MSFLTRARQALTPPLTTAASLGPRFWLFALGIFLVARGATMVHPALGYLLPGLLLIWDVTRPTPPAPPPRPGAR